MLTFLSFKAYAYEVWLLHLSICLKHLFFCTCHQSWSLDSLTGMCPLTRKMILIRAKNAKAVMSKQHLLKRSAGK